MVAQEPEAADHPDEQADQQEDHGDQNPSAIPCVGVVKDSERPAQRHEVKSDYQAHEPGGGEPDGDYPDQQADRKPVRTGSES